MKLTKQEILAEIQKLEPLQILDFKVYEESTKDLEIPRKVSNLEILTELDNICSKNIESKKQTRSKNINKDKEFAQDQAKQTEKVNEAFRKTYYGSTLKSLRFSESPTFFSPLFKDQVKETVRKIVKNRSYEELSKDELNTLHSELQDLSTVEFEWKEYSRRTITKEMAHQQFHEEYEKFLVNFETVRNPSLENLRGQRAERKYMSYKVGQIAHCLIKHVYVKLKYKPLKFCKDFTAEQLGKIVVEHIDPKRVFNDLARISVKKAHEKLLSLREESRYKDDVLSISKVELYAEFKKTLVVEIFYAILALGEKEHNLSSETADVLSRNVQIMIYYRNLLTVLEASCKKEYLQFSDLTNSVLETFISSGFFTGSVTANVKNKKNKTITQLILPEHIVVAAYRPLKFPNIVRPPVLKKKDIDLLIKPLLHGQASLTKSNHLVATLNMSRAKVHKVSTLFLEMCKRFFPEKPLSILDESVLGKWLNEGFIDIGTLHLGKIVALDEERNYLKERNSMSVLSLNVANAIYDQLSLNNNFALNSFRSLLKPCGISTAETLRFHAATVRESEYVSGVIDWKFTQSRLFLAELLKGFPLYITDTLCIRLRMYPREHWLSRTAGSLKHLLQNFKPRKLTIKGLVTLLEAYYQCDPIQLAEFKLYISKTNISKKSGKKLLTTYFNNNPIDFTQIRKPMYFLNLHMELLYATKNGFYTGVNVEIDQNASALAILSIVLRSKEMADVCNMTGKPEAVSPYDYIRDKCDMFLQSEEGQELNIPEYQDVVEFLKSSRSLHKYAIMCFCYNQTSLGRMDDFSNEWLKEFGFSPDVTQKTALNKFASLYPKFVDFVFPNTLRRLEIFKEIVQLVCAEAPHIQMKTIDGEVINWSFYAMSSSNRKWYDTVEGTHKSSKTKVLQLRDDISTDDTSTDLDFPTNIRLDSMGMSRRFLSYLIHSIDASILRRIIYSLKKKHKISVNHLHDCVILHPNDVDAFYEVVKEIYVSPELYDIVIDGVFDSVGHILSPESNTKLEELKEEFLELSSDFNEEILGMNPRHLYSLED